MQVLKILSILVLCQLLGASDTIIQIERNKKVSIAANKNSYDNMELLELTVSCKNKGYITILYISETGYIGVVKDNAVCNRVYIAPDKDEEFAFQMENSRGLDISEKYIAFYSTKKINTSIFKTLNYDKYYQELGKTPLEVFMNAHKDFSYVTVTIKGKKNEF